MWYTWENRQNGTKLCDRDSGRCCDSESLPRTAKFVMVSARIEPDEVGGRSLRRFGKEMARNIFPFLGYNRDTR